MTETKEVQRYQEVLALSQTVEKELLSTLFISNDSVIPLLSEINPSDFYYYREQYETLIEAKLHKTDPIAIARKKDIPLMGCLSSAVFGEPIVFAKQLKEISRTRKIYAVLQTAIEAITPVGISDQVASMQQKLLEITSDSQDEKMKILDIMKDYEAQQDVYRKLPAGSIIGIPTGFQKIDEVIDGIRAPHFWIVGGYTSVGKTFFSLNLMLSVLKNKKSAVLYSLEMSKIDVVSRLIGILSDQNGIKILKGYEDDRTKEAKEFLNQCDLRVINKRRNLKSILLSMHEQKLLHQVDVFVIDYIQQIEVDGASSEYETMREVAIQFQKISEKLGVPIIVVSQISNEAAKTPNSAVMGFKGAGTIASAADFAIELVPSEENIDELRRKLMNGLPIRVKAIIKKNRHGRTGTIELEFDGKTGRFHNDSLDNFVGQLDRK